MNYEELSDFEINKRVAESRPYTWVVGDGSCPAVSESAVSIEYKTFKYGNLISHGVDYCNHPEDAWPIIFENKITIQAPDNGILNSSMFEWDASGDYYLEGGASACVFSTHENPLRAAMICYLMMQEAK